MGLVLLAAVLACYNGALGGDFVWDDEYIVVRNPLVRAPLLSFEVFRQDIINSGFVDTIYYRPVQILSYALDHRIWGTRPFGFHLTGILLHFLNGLLVLVLTRKLTGDQAVSFLTALLFVIHPAHSGAVSYISSRTDLLFFFFGFSGMLFFVMYADREKPGLLAASVVCLVFSMLSKEGAVVFPFLILFMDATVLRGRHRFRAAPHLAFFAVAACYIGLHRFFFSETYGRLFAGGQGSWIPAEWLSMFGESLAFISTASDAHMRRAFTSPGSGIVLPVVLAFALLSIAILRGLRKKLLFSLGFFIISIIPFILVAGYFNVLGEHWLYLPGYGILLFLALALTAFYRRFGGTVKACVIVLMLFMVGSFSVRASMQSVYWGEGVALSDRVLAFSRMDLPAMHYKAAEFLEQGRQAESMEIMREYAAAGGGDARTWYIKGRFTLSTGGTDEAVRDFNRALELDPSYSDAYVGLALAAFAESEDEKGELYLRKAVQTDPRDSEALLLLGSAILERGDAQKALEVMKRAEEINPYDYNVLVNLGTVHTRAGDLREGARCYMRAAELYPEKPLAYYNLGQVFYAGGQKEEAVRYLEKALKADPSYKPAVQLLHKLRNE